KPQAAAEGVLALVYTQQSGSDADAIFAKLETMANAPMSDSVLRDCLRVIQLAFIRDKSKDARDSFKQAVGPVLLAKFPSNDLGLNRELQVVLAHMQTPGALDALLAYLTPDKSQEEQIHTVYCLRTIDEGWSREQRDKLVAWFDTARHMAGGASFEGFINNLWTATLDLLPKDEVKLAEAHKEDLLKQEAEAA